MSDKGTHTIELLGLVADHQRNIRPGFEYDKYFPKANNETIMLKRDGTVRNTVKFMDDIVRKTLGDTAKIAQLLKGKTLDQTCKNVWDFIYNYIQYKLDDDGVEQLRRPSRSWMNRNTGVDCDCMSIFTSSILTNLGISHKFRVTKYHAGWQHVYVVVPLPTDQKKYYVIDCVLNQFNYEKPYTDNFDYTMTTTTLSGIPITMLGSLEKNTIDLHDEIQAVINGTHLKCLSNADDSLLGDVETYAKPAYDALLQHITATRDVIRKNPDSVLVVGGAKAYLKMLDYAIAKWNTPGRNEALELLAKEEDRWNKQVENISGVDDVSIDDEQELRGFDGELLGKLKIGGAGKKFFNNIKESVKAVDKFNKDVVKKVGGKAGEKLVAKTEEMQAKATEAAKKVAVQVKQAATKVGEAIKKFVVLSNPLTLLMRAGVLMAMKVNLFGMAERLYPALLSKEEAAKKNVPEALWLRSKNGLDKVSKVFEAIGGKRSKLEKYIKNGLAGKKKTLAGLGAADPYSAAAAIIAAAATLVTAASKMKEAGVNKRDYDQLKRQEAAKQAPKRRTSNYSTAGFGEAEDASAEVVEPNTSEADVPESEQFDLDSSGNIDESKKGIAKFIEAIKKWFSKNKKAADEADASAVISEEQADVPNVGDNVYENPTVAENAAKSDTTEYVALVEAEKAVKAAISSGASETEALEVASRAYKAAGGAYVPMAASSVAELSAKAEASRIKAEISKAAYEKIKNQGDGFFTKIGAFAKKNPVATALIGATVVAGIALAVSPKARAFVGIGKAKPKLKSPAALNGVEVYRKGKKIKKVKRVLPKNSKVKRIVLK